MRRPLLALAVLAAGGCAPATGVTDVELDTLRGREVPLTVTVTGVRGDWAEIAVTADVRAAGASWASLTPEGDLGESGVTQRFSSGEVVLELGRTWFQPNACDGGVCVLDYTLALDIEPTVDWNAIITVELSGDGADAATVVVAPAS